MNWVISLGISGVGIYTLFWWIRRYKKLTIGEGVFWAMVILVIGVFIALRLGG